MKDIMNKDIIIVKFLFLTIIHILLDIFNLLNIEKYKDNILELLILKQIKKIF